MGKLHLRVLIALLVIGSGVAGGVSAAADDEYTEILKQSIQASKEVPYAGVFTYKHFTSEGEWETWLSVSRRSASEKKVEVLYPKQLSEIAIVQSEGGLWMTPLKEDELNKIKDVIKPVAWYRALKNGEVLEFEDFGLLMRNYYVKKEGHVEVAGRPAWKLAIRSRMPKRPSAIICVDKQTKIQLKYERYDYDGKLVESFEFNRVDAPYQPFTEPLSHEGLVKVADMNGPPDDDSIQEEIHFTPMKPADLPKGFNRKFVHSWKGRDGAIFHVLYTDGFAGLSLYQRLQTEEEKKNADKDQEDAGVCAKVNKYSRHGRDVYFRDVDGLRVSAVGDLDPCEIALALSELKPGEDLLKIEQK